MNRKDLIKRYVSNFDKLKLDTKNRLQKDLEVFGDFIFEKLEAVGLNLPTIVG